MAANAASMSFNSAPAVHAPGSYTIEDVFPLPLTGIVFSDSDAGGAAELATFTADFGFLSAIAGNGVTVTGSGTSTLTLSGTIADLNAFIAAGKLGYFGQHQDVLHVTIDDGGHSGAGGAMTASIDVPIAFEGFPAPRPATDGDFNGDHFGDLLLSSDNGAHALWQMQENVLLNAAAVLPDTGPTWHAKAAVDFDPVDGFSDILWQNDNGAVAIWQMHGATIVGDANLPNPGAATHVVDAKDFDGNGGADILLQNDDGALSLWLMQDATHVGSTVKIAQNPGAPWHAVAGDFNGDGKAGIVFTTANGGTAIWEDLSDNGSGQGRFDVQANLQDNGRTWHVKATGDFDGDHKDDILWQNDNGLAAIWLMDGAHVKSGHNVAGSEANGRTWHAADARDMNGDGRADIVWQNDSGAIALWENFSLGSNGAAVFATQLNVASPPHADWHVL